MPGQKVSIEVPEGMTPERLLKLVSQYESQKVTGKARDKAKRAAVSQLVTAHQEEFNTLYAAAGGPAK